MIILNDMSKIILSTSNYTGFKELLAAKNGAQIGVIERRKFPDGEIYHRVKTIVKDCDVIIVGGTLNDEDLMEIYELSCAVVKYGARSLSLYIPFFGYSTMERAIESGEIVKAKTRARLLSNIPNAYQGNSIYLLDLHAENINHYFEGSIHSFHLSSKQMIVEHIREKKLENYVLASTDAGRAKDVQKMANLLGCDIALIIKKRTINETIAVAISADVKGKHVVIYDDMIRSGGSVIEAVKAYKEAGAATIEVITVHGIFCSNAVEKIKQAGVSLITCTNSYPSKNYKQEDVVTIDISSVFINL